MLSDIWEESSGAAVLEDLARERGMVKVLRIVLESRFGTLDDDIVTSLRGSDEAALETVGRHVTTGTLEQIRALVVRQANSEQ